MNSLFSSQSKGKRVIYQSELTYRPRDWNHPPDFTYPFDCNTHRYINLLPKNQMLHQHKLLTEKTFVFNLETKTSGSPSSIALEWGSQKAMGI